jgi:outer membrane protein OmpA-like peptidoglycan-associated protein
MVPDFNAPLTENYTIEFDVKGLNISDNTSSLANLNITLSDNAKLSWGDNYANVTLNFCQYIAQGPKVSNRFKADEDRLQNTISRDLRSVFLDVAHVSIAVNGKRFRLWVNESKLVDLPRFISQPELITNLKFQIEGFNEDKYDERLLITNLKIAQGGVDLRSALLKEGRFSTTGILFDSGSHTIKPESFGTLKMIADALKQESGMKILILGHTDADGSDTANLELSKKRAASVKEALTSNFGVPSSDLETDGKGESEPIANNTTTEGKAQNRRVEFIKQ